MERDSTLTLDVGVHTRWRARRVSLLDIREWEEVREPLNQSTTKPSHVQVLARQVFQHRA